MYANQYAKKPGARGEVIAEKGSQNPLLTETDLTNPMFALGSKKEIQDLFSKILKNRDTPEKKNKRYWPGALDDQYYCNSVVEVGPKKQPSPKRASPLRVKTKPPGIVR